MIKILIVIVMVVATIKIIMLKNIVIMITMIATEIHMKSMMINIIW